MNTVTTDNLLRRIKLEIRADAERVRVRAAQIEFRPIAVGAIETAKLEEFRDNYTIEELSSKQFSDFVNVAFYALLRRGADSAGFAKHIRTLEQGRSKIEVLGDLRYCAEGQKIGVRVPWLLPRYMLAKATSIPLLGYFIEWLMCLGGLPRLMRHQRAADAYHAARSFELREAVREQRATSGSLAEGIGRGEEARARLEEDLDHVSSRFVPVHAELGQAFSELRDLRHLVMSGNHWLSSLRQNLSALEASEGERMRENDVLNAEVARRVISVDPSRPARIEQWIDLFVTGLSARAEILDIGAGLDWLRALTDRGLEVSGVDESSAFAQRAIGAGISVANADPSSVLARIADHSLDAVSVLDIAALARSLPIITLLQILKRVVRPEGRVLMGAGEEHGSVIDRLQGRARINLDLDLIEHALSASGFVGLKRSSSGDGVSCIVATRPES